MNNEITEFVPKDLSEEITDHNINKDLQEVRDNIKKLNNSGQRVLERIEENVLVSDDPDYVNEFTKLLKVMGDIQGKFMENVNERKNVGEGSFENQIIEDKRTQNVIIVDQGSPQDMIEKLTKNGE